MGIYVKNEEASKYFDPRGKGETKNGLKEGHWKEFLFDRFYYYKEEEGIVNYYVENLLTYGEGNYKAGKRTGKWNLYLIENETRKKFLSLTANYSENIRDGKMIYYFPNGKKAAESKEIKGEVNGKLTSFYSSGNIYQVIHYRHGKGEGETKIYYETGEIKHVYNFCNGIICGSSIGYYKSGNKKFENSYLDGELNGKSVHWYENGNIKEKCFYILGKLDNIFQYYYPSGQLWVEREYENGLLKEVNHLYDKNGKELDHGTLSNGNGTLFYYTEEGVIYLTRVFKDGIQVSKD